jgi:hypothetical protein
VNHAIKQEDRAFLAGIVRLKMLWSRDRLSKRGVAWLAATMLWSLR